mmetsp:Transcript_55646/g.143364  ORF Transcript_55646/g.143364 Transcript_55646/m.143364 type:complete len:458 (+) Transcript_55646:176-1549(+)
MTHEPSGYAEWDPFADPADFVLDNPSSGDSFTPPELAGLSSAGLFLEANLDCSDQGNEAQDLQALEAAYAGDLLQGLPHEQLELELVDFASDNLNSKVDNLSSLADPDNIVSEADEVRAIDVSSIEVEGAYEGPVYKSGEITPEFCQELLQWQKEGNVLAKRYAYSIVLDIIEQMKSLSTLVDIDVPSDGEITVCGDVHGQYYDLLNIWEVNGEPSEDNPYLFNGDFVDRGSFSVEVIMALFAWKLCFPRHLHMARGNHESQMMNRIYGFEGEVRHKYDIGLYTLMCEAFCLLPLCHVINHKVFVVHGGLFSQDDITLDDIRSVDRVCEPLDEGLMVEMLWSDPQPGWGRAASKRGVAVSFGQDVTENFLNTNNLQLVIRSHELRDDGYAMEHGGQLITVFSAPNYCDQMGNMGAFIRLDGQTLTPRPQSFAAVPHPPVRAMHYANPWPLLGGFGLM